ncbi:MAG: flavodoxin [Erysipelotrichaceae bacterium]|nr:flavodoxin [Erysipelotrichaceae bacterium]MDD4643180.1 flavodoxin [Erysipelotrichaceae bacterium]
MKKIAVVYWSGTGNTEAMANAVVEGAQAEGVDVMLYQAADFNADLVADFDALAFGCPSMGAEQLEEDVFEPMFAAVEPHLSTKNVALFGSYGWGDGEWMRSWEERCSAAGIILVTDSVIGNDYPDDEVTEACKAVGKTLAVL